MLNTKKPIQRLQWKILYGFIDYCQEHADDMSQFLEDGEAQDKMIDGYMKQLARQRKRTQQEEVVLSTAVFDSMISAILYEPQAIEELYSGQWEPDDKEIARGFKTAKELSEKALKEAR